MTTPPELLAAEAGRRCYGCDKHPAAYEAHLDYDATPVVLLCLECGIRERGCCSVVWIRNVDQGTPEHP